MATLEERVARLEHLEESRQLDAAMRSHAYGISLVQAGVAEGNARQAEVQDEVTALRAEVGEMRTDLTAKLDAILERLNP